MWGGSERYLIAVNKPGSIFYFGYLVAILLGMRCNDSLLGSFWGQLLWVSSPRALAATLAAISEELFDRECLIA